MRVSPLDRDLAAALAELRGRLESDYGWTHLKLEIRVDLEARRVLVHGEIAAPGLAARVHGALEQRCRLEGLALTLELRPIPVRRWHLLPSTGLTLWRGHSLDRRCTELEIGDGPVGWLAEHAGASLVRGRDGTSGWTDRPLGAACPPRLIAPPRDAPIELLRARVLARARAFLAVPYLLGGSSEAQVDCSGLVQRALSAVGLLVPRHSNDQLALARPSEGPAQVGDLVFILSRAQARTHVGIAAGPGRIVQASLSHRRVIEQEMGAYLDDAQWQRVLPLPRVLTWARAQVGRESIALPSPPLRSCDTPDIELALRSGSPSSARC